MDTDKQRLKETVSENWYILESNDVTKKFIGDGAVDDDVVFGTDRDFERDKLIQEMKSVTTEKITLRIAEDDGDVEEVVDFDDI